MPKDASDRALSDATLRFDLALGVRRRRAPNGLKIDSALVGSADGLEVVQDGPPLLLEAVDPLGARGPVRPVAIVRHIRLQADIPVAGSSLVGNSNSIYAPRCIYRSKGWRIGLLPPKPRYPPGTFSKSGGCQP